MRTPVIIGRQLGGSLGLRIACRSLSRIAVLEGERLRLRAFAEYQRHGRVWIDRFGHRPLRRILPLDVQAWATRRRAEVEPATVNRELSFLRRVFSMALANGLVQRNPVKAVKFFHEPSGRVRFLTADISASSSIPPGGRS